MYTKLHMYVGLKHSAMIDQFQQEQEAVQIFSLYATYVFNKGTTVCKHNMFMLYTFNTSSVYHACWVNSWWLLVYRSVWSECALQYCQKETPKLNVVLTNLGWNSGQIYIHM